MSKKKCAVVIEEGLPAGLAMNAAVILGMSYGARLDGPLGADLPDANGVVHVGLTQVPVPILTADQDALRELRSSAQRKVGEELLVIDFTEEAQSSATYALYAERLAAVGVGAATYRGILLAGKQKLVDRLTKGLLLYG